jgi:hypothetical protein
MRRSRFFIAAVFAAMLASVPSTIEGQSSTPNDNRIRARISTPKRSIRTGELISIDAEITNVSGDAIFICNRIGPGPGPCLLRLWLEDVQGNKVPQKNFVVDMPPPPRNETPLQALSRLWLPLQPKHTLRTTLFLPENEGKPLKPGRYTIRGFYYSYGIDAPDSIRRDLLISEDFAKLPYQVFQGSVNTNSIAIVIRPATR